MESGVVFDIVSDGPTIDERIANCGIVKFGKGKLDVGDGFVTAAKVF